MTEKLIEKLRWWFLPHKRFYSYYVANTSKMEFGGYWQKVKYFQNIPDELKEIRGAWRKHTR